jgi:hypothetical protein
MKSPGWTSAGAEVVNAMMNMMTVPAAISWQRRNLAELDIG